MSKQTYYTKLKPRRRRRRKLHIPRIIGTCLILVLLIFGISYGIDQYKNPGLIGEWNSVETGEVVSFRNDGTVFMKSTGNIADYNILGPNQLYYIINDITFDMYYKIDGRTLVWGIDENNVEVFTRK